MASKIENPFSTRFVSSEQRELYLQMKEDEKLVTMPVIEQDELEAFHYIIRIQQERIMQSPFLGESQ